MTTTYENILELTKIFRELAVKKMQGQLAYKIMRIIKVLDKENENFNQARAKIILKYAELDSNGNPKQQDGQIIIKKEKAKLCQEELKQLLNTKIKIEVDSLNYYELKNIKITPTQAFYLEDFIK